MTLAYVEVILHIYESSGLGSDFRLVAAGSLTSDHAEKIIRIRSGRRALEEFGAHRPGAAAPSG